jgi:DNA invertase Pin-like site-specific DNA recombinase
MVSDAEARKFDLLLTKEISRFARNTLDSIYYTRELKKYGVGVLFMNDNINTFDPDAELRLTIMSSIAQEESRKTSERVRWGQKRQMEKGVVFGVKMLGYNLKDGKLTINEDEAKIVRLIFDLYLSGMGIALVCKELANRGILSPSGAMKWENATVRQILRNEKYMGVLKQKKSVTTDYLSHKRKANEGEEQCVIIENNHASIVDREIFDRAQRELVRRRNVTLEKGRYSNRYVWSGKIKCAYCNSTFRRKVDNRKSQNPVFVWHCSQADKYGTEKINAQGQKVGCNCKGIHERVLEENFLAVLNAVIENKDLVVRELQEYVRKTIDESPDKSSEIKAIMTGMAKIGTRKSKLLDLHVDGVITRAEFDKANNQYNKQLDALESQLLALEHDNKLIVNLTQKLANVETTIETLVRLKEFSDSICGEVLSKVIVEGREKMSFYLTTAENEDPIFFKIPLLVTQSTPSTPAQ